MIKLSESKTPAIDAAKIAAGLGAKHYVLPPHLSREESEQYRPLGSPVLLPIANQYYIYHLGSRMLRTVGLSLDDVVGYRILDLSGESELRKRWGRESNPIACYYGNESSLRLDFFF